MSRRHPLDFRRKTDNIISENNFDDLKENFIHVCFVIDESGSMAGTESDIIGGFRKVVDEQKAVKDGTVYSCAGYTLETWENGAWGVPVTIAAFAVTVFESEKVRITWRWQGGGTVLSVR